MKRQSTDPKHYLMLHTFDDFLRAHGGTLNDGSSHTALIDELSASLQDHRSNPALVHGLHVQSMFAHVIAELGKCELIIEEDSGGFYSAHEDLRRPDFRIHLRVGDPVLVEVKNFHQTASFAPYRIKPSYMASLQRYADILSLPLYFAVYWSRWNLWTLTRSDAFDLEDGKHQVNMGDAMKRNEMGMVGDCSIGTVPPLSLRLFSAPGFPRPLDKEGQFVFKVGRACLCAGDKEITDAVEQKIAWFLMLYGSWNKIEQPAHMVDARIDYFDIQVSPEEPPEEQRFCLVGYMSQMLSTRYKQFTADPEGVSRLTPNSQPTQMSGLIPEGYKGKALPIWHFTQLPNYEDIDKGNAV